MTTLQLHNQLRALNSERASASLEGIDRGPYLDDLRAAIEATRTALVGAAVTEIASLRGQLSGRQEG